MKPQASETSGSNEPDSPAIIRDHHVQDRTLHTRAGSKSGWSVRPIYEKEYLAGHLCCREKCKTKIGMETEVMVAYERYQAAKQFDEGWRICTASWPSGSDLNRVRVMCTPGSFVDHQRASKDFWRRVEANMGANDWMICRRVCGENYKVAETVIAIQPGYRDSTLARFREALDALIIGIDRAGKL